MQETSTPRIIVILTNSYPYKFGEPFFEAEVQWWGIKRENSEVWLFPSESDEVEARDVPKNLKVYTKWSRIPTWRRLLLGLWNAPFRLVPSELKVMARKNVLGYKSIFGLLTSCAKTGYHRYTLNQFVKEYGKISIIYCYWNSERSYAATLLKKDRSVSCVVSRVHGYDLFEDRRSGEYMPLKSSLIGQFDEIYPLSDQAANYLHSVYGADPAKLLVCPLGVEVPDLSCLKGEKSKHYFSLLSVSNCVPVKRIDRIIDGIAIAANNASHKDFVWTHIGGGPLLSKLKRYARGRLSSFPNVRYEFLGEIANSCVKDFYSENYIDIFLNSSDSEGMPVSIMEAMSFGVPVIAPDIGSVSELVCNETGWLLSHNSADSIGEYIVSATKFQLINRKREQARLKIKKLFDENNNYSRFVGHVMRVGADFHENNQ